MTYTCCIALPHYCTLINKSIFFYSHFIIIVILAAQALVIANVYNFIINYHIIIYLLLLLIPISSLVNNTLVLPFAIFINFFWTFSIITVVLCLPNLESIFNVSLFLYKLAIVLISGI